MNRNPILVTVALATLAMGPTALANSAAPADQPPPAEATAQPPSPEPVLAEDGTLSPDIAARLTSAQLTEVLKEQAWQHREAIPRDVAARLSPEQLTEVLKEEARAKNGGLTAVVGAAGFFAAVLGGLLAVCFTVLRVQRMRQDTLRQAIEKGQVPPELLAPEPVALRDLRRGILWIAGGAGLSLALVLILSVKTNAAIGLLPVFVGLGYVASSWVARSRMNTETRTES